MVEESETAVAWHAAVAKVLKGGSAADLLWRTRDGIVVAPLAPPAEALHPVALPPARRWSILQRLDHPDPAAANGFALDDVEGGADGLVLVAADAPSARGFGLRLQDAEVLATALAGIDVGAVALRLEAGRQGLAAAYRLADYLVRVHPATAQLRVDFGCDPLGADAVAGSLPQSWAATRRDLAELHETLRGQGFTTPLLRADGRVWHDAGASEAQELGAVLAAGLFYLRSLEAEGIAPEEGRRALSFTLGAETDPLLTITKFRALRRLWAAIETACGLAPRPIRLHAETAWRSLARDDPHTNLLRATSAAFAAAVGGADSIHVLPFTAAWGLPDGAARRLARNTQLILAEEAQLWRVADPAAGSGVFEALTQDLVRGASALLQEIEREGGLPASLAAGRLQARIAASRAARAADLAAGREGLVGVTLFRPAVPTEVTVLAPSPAAGPGAAPFAAHRLSEPFETTERRPA